MTKKRHSVTFLKTDLSHKKVRNFKGFRHFCDIFTLFRPIKYKRKILYIIIGAKNCIFVTKGRFEEEMEDHIEAEEF